MSQQPSERKISYVDLKQLDEVLEQKNLRRFSVHNDGNCFYDALVHQLSFYGAVESRDELRKRFVKYLYEHNQVGGVVWQRVLDTGETKDEYLSRHSLDKEFADDIILKAAAESLCFTINVVNPKDSMKVEPESKPLGELIVGRVDNNKYVTLERTEANGYVTKPSEQSVLNQPTFKPRGILKQSKWDEMPKMEYGRFQYLHDQDYTRNLYDQSRRSSTNTTDDEFDENISLLEEESEDHEEKEEAYQKYKVTARRDESRATSEVVKFFKKLFKFASYFILGGSVLAGALVSKAALMILVNSAKPYLPSETVAAEQEVLLLEHDIIRAWSFIILLVTLLVPEVLTMIHSFLQMRSEKWIGWKYLLWGGIWEVLDAFGESILFLKVFPYLDATLALLILPLVSFFPACINLYTNIAQARQRKQDGNTAEIERKTESALQNLSPVSIEDRKRKTILSCYGGFIEVATILVFQLVALATLLYACFGDVKAYFDANETYGWALGGVLLMSVRYWENFVIHDLSFFNLFSMKAEKMQRTMDLKRFQTSFFYSFIKCLILTGMTFLIFVVWENTTYSSNHVCVNSPPGFSGTKNSNFSSARYYRIISLLWYEKGQVSMRAQVLQQLWYVAAVQICCSFGAFFFGRVACMTMIQPFSFTLPLALTTPVISAFSAALAVYKQSGGAKSLLTFVGLAAEYKGINTLTYYIDWNNVLFFGSFDYTRNGVISESANADIIASVFVIIGLILGWASFLLLTRFTWKNPQNKLERTEALFVKPIYGGPMIDQALLINRRKFSQHSMNQQNGFEDVNEDETGALLNESEQRNHNSSLQASFYEPSQLFVCATMWHENKKEMTQLLTSLMRLDKKVKENYELNHEDYYEFQAHILFDDAIKMPKEGKQKEINSFVHQLCDLIPVAANKVKPGNGDDVHSPLIYPTPYGGRIEYVMPYDTLLIIHLKDNEKIRARKRWSQCMYMYYILGYLCETKKRYSLNRIFLLALDGDVDFQPGAVNFLLDRMRRNSRVGAACGRIHPIGSGPVVWFQKFEYAVGHWLQKTAEHVIGCVLCSPGCFSLFRGSALVKDNVIKQYIEKATKASQKVQWDQGEDRWLCTLLLKQNWRIEYSATSDSYTFAPESFKELYQQRRRWGPSTMANVLDILMDAKYAVKSNKYVTWIYIAYQFGLTISSLIGPATVIMIVQGAYQYVFKWNATVSLIVSILPVIVFIILCYVTSADTQINVASILTLLYALVMTAVMVGVIGSLATNALLDPNNIFMVTLVGLYLFTGLLHPQEIMCLIHGILYYLCVPSAFIFLMVYSLTNLNDVSWGTRESEEHQTSVAVEQEHKSASKQKGKDVRFSPSGSASTKGITCGLGTICQCTFCVQPEEYSYQPVPATEINRGPPKQRRPTKASAEAVYEKLSKAKARHLAATPEEQEKEKDKIKKNLSKRMSVVQLRQVSERNKRKSVTTSKIRRMSTVLHRKSLANTTQAAEETRAKILSESCDPVDVDLNVDEENVDDDRREHEDKERLDWISRSLNDGKVDYLEDDEVKFWKFMIDNYLYPNYETKDEKEKIKKNLVDLRNQVTGAFFLLNALWIILNFALQLTITDIAITFYVNGNLVSVNPVSFAFLLFFIIILVVQFLCMLKHRWTTALHFLSSETLLWEGGRDDMKNTDVLPTASQLNKSIGNASKERHSISSLKTNWQSTCGQNPSFSMDEEKDSIEMKELENTSPSHNYSLKPQSLESGQLFGSLTQRTVNFEDDNESSDPNDNDNEIKASFSRLSQVNNDFEVEVHSNGTESGEQHNNRVKLDNSIEDYSSL